MFTVFREHSRTITRLLAYQFGAAFLGISLALAVPNENRILQLITSIFSVCFLLYLNHTVLWEEGAKSRIRVDAGREKYAPATGLFIGIVASLPNIILGIVTSVGYFFGSADGLFGWEIAANISAVSRIIAFFWQGMYIGLVQFLFRDSTYIYLAVPIPVILGCFCSYWLGLKQWKIASAFKAK